MDNLHPGISASRNGSVNNPVEHQYANKQLNACRNSGADTIQELGNALRHTLQVKDDTSESPSDEDGSSGLEDENSAVDHELNLGGLDASSSKCLHKCATFPVGASSEGKTPELQLESKGCTRSISLPSVHKLVPAIKGSREKEGAPPKKLSVSWAPDVYDPPPTSVSHFPKKKTQQQSKGNKKHGKGKQKGKSSRSGGSAPKDKKHHRKIGGRSDRGLNSCADTDRVHNYQPSLRLLNFSDVGDDIGSPDRNCGSNFLGQASGTMHCVC